ncbi:MAG: helicase HerA-like domain-containing protein, partial [Pseudomonadota bacterium]
ITQLGVGEALVSTLQKKGIPSVVDQTLICPPMSRIGPATPDERSQTRSASPVGGLYDETVDRESAYEILTRRAEEEKAFEEAEQRRREQEKEQKRLDKERAKAKRAARPRRSNRQTVFEAAAKSVVRSVGSQVGRQIGRSLLRGILGSFMR